MSFTPPNENNHPDFEEGMASSVSRSLTNTASQPENTSSTITSQLTAVVAVALASTSNDTLLETIDNEGYGPPLSFIATDDDPFPSKIFFQEPAVVIETTALADGDPPPMPCNTTGIEGAENEAGGDSIVAPLPVIIEDEPAQCRSTPRLRRVLSFVVHRGNQGGDESHVDRMSDSTYHVPVADLVMNRDSEEAIIATQLEPWWKQRRPQLILCSAIVLAIAFAIALGVIIEKSNDDLPEASSRVSSSAAPSNVAFPPTLVQLRKEGVLRCGVPVRRGFSVFNQVTGEKEGMSVDFCKAVAAAVMGHEGKVELIDVTAETRFPALANGSIDLLIFGDTHTMERDFHEVLTGTGFQFTDPYLYDWLGFAGDPLAVGCADKSNWSGECSDLKICLRSGTTHEEILQKIFPPMTLVPKEDDPSALINGLVNSDCNVIAGEQYDISEVVARDRGYTGSYEYGMQQFSKEPLAFVTRKNDQSWTDAVNWVLRFLIRAELINLTQSTIDQLSSLDEVFRNDIDFISALRAAGNYGEIYSRNIERLVPRKTLNLLHSFSDQNRTGLHYIPPTGSIDDSRHSFALDGKINEILNREKLICGVIGNEHQSIETDHCRALSASLFFDKRKVDIVKLSDESEVNMMKKLDSGEVDVIAGATVRYSSDIISSNESASGLSGLAFSQPYFYGEISYDHSQHGWLNALAMATSQTDADWSTYVYWVVANLIGAEEENTTSAVGMNRPVIKLFGPKFEGMFQGPISEVGNYDEIYSRNIDSLPPRANENLINRGSPQHWPHTFKLFAFVVY